jgi:hypothetical protein
MHCQATLTPVQVTDGEAQAELKAQKEAYDVNPSEVSNRYRMAAARYAITKYVRADNTPENAKYFGYISADELFPDFKYKRYTNFADELIAGKIKKPYPHVNLT